MLNPNRRNPVVIRSFAVILRSSAPQQSCAKNRSALQANLLCLSCPSIRANSLALDVIDSACIGMLPPVDRPETPYLS